LTPTCCEGREIGGRTLAEGVTRGADSVDAVGLGSRALWRTLGPASFDELLTVRRGGRWSRAIPPSLSRRRGSGAQGVRFRRSGAGARAGLGGPGSRGSVGRWGG